LPSVFERFTHPFFLFAASPLAVQKPEVDRVFNMRKKIQALFRNERFLIGMEISVAICALLIILILLRVLLY